MLTLTLGSEEYFDEEKSEFVQVGGSEFEFEHCLKAISKWESKYNIPFLVDGDKTQEQSLYYISCMALTPEFTIDLIDDTAMETINEYLTQSHTATTIKDIGGGQGGKIITSEVLYSYLSICEIPYDVDVWNLDRMLMTIQAISALKSPPKKMTRDEIIAQNAKINEQRMAEMEASMNEE